MAKIEMSRGPDAGPDAAERTYRVLVVDDNPINRRLCGLICELMELQVAYACDGGEAIELAGLEAFDLILMDINMPGVSGVEATQAIRALKPPTCWTPIIAVSSADSPAEAALYRASGMDDVVSKPLGAHDLMGAISRALTRPAEPRSWQEKG